MIIDISFAVIVLISMLAGYRRGFAGTFIKTFGWIISAAGAWFSQPYVSKFLTENTGFYDEIKERILTILISETDSALPDVFTVFFENAAEETADRLAQISFTVLVFIAVLLVIRIVLNIIAGFFSRDRDSVIGFINATAGMFIGIIRGVLISVILSLLMIPSLTLLPESSSQVLADQISGSKTMAAVYELFPADGLFRDMPQNDGKPVLTLKIDHADK